MRKTRRIVVCLLALMILLSQLWIPAGAKNYGNIHTMLGSYEGTVTNSYGSKKIFFTLLETKALPEDLSALQTCVDGVNTLQTNLPQKVDAAVIRDYIVTANLQYVGLMYTDSLYTTGLCVMSVSYNENSGMYHFGSKRWFPEDYFGYTNLDKMVYKDGIFTGEQWDGGTSEYKSGDVTLHRVSNQTPLELPYTLAVFSDHSDMRVEAGDVITLSAGVWEEGQVFGDPSGVTFQLSDPSVVSIQETGFAEGCLYLRLRGELEGSTDVTFSDSATGLSSTVSLTVVENHYATFTLGNVPVERIGDFDTNFYNYNGLYIDNYSYSVSDQGIALVCFDVYNTDYIYGIVESYTEDGQLQNAVLIDKMTGLNSGIKQVLWDGTCCVVRDLISGNALTYRQETNFSKRTSVQIEVPKNGYLKITVDPVESNILGVINGADFVSGALSLAGKMKGYSNTDTEFPEALCSQLVKDTAWEHFREDGSKFFTNINRDLTKQILITPEAIGDFTDTISRQLQELKVMDVVKKSLWDSGIDFGEDVFKDLLGIYGSALDGVFLIGSGENLARQYIDNAYAPGSGAIVLQNQGGGRRCCQQIRAESTTAFGPDTALQVFTVALEADLLEKVRQADAETYEMLTKGIMHTYDISLRQNGEAVQHADKVTVYIPIPEELRMLSLLGNVSIYRIEEDGTLTDMYAVVEDDCMKFTTDHFSLYAMVKRELPPSSETPTEPQPAAPEIPFDFGKLLLMGGISSAVLAVIAAVVLLIVKGKRRP